MKTITFELACEFLEKAYAVQVADEDFNGRLCSPCVNENPDGTPRIELSWYGENELNENHFNEEDTYQLDDEGRLIINGNSTEKKTVTPLILSTFELP
jgi:hypothetical protein